MCRCQFDASSIPVSTLLSFLATQPSQFSCAPSPFPLFLTLFYSYLFYSPYLLLSHTPHPLIASFPVLRQPLSSLASPSPHRFLTSVPPMSSPPQSQSSSACFLPVAQSLVRKLESSCDDHSTHSPSEPSDDQSDRRYSDFSQASFPDPDLQSTDFPPRRPSSNYIPNFHCTRAHSVHHANNPLETQPSDSSRPLPRLVHKPRSRTVAHTLTIDGPSPSVLAPPSSNIPIHQPSLTLENVTSTRAQPASRPLRNFSSKTTLQSPFEDAPPSPYSPPVDPGDSPNASSTGALPTKHLPQLHDPNSTNRPANSSNSLPRLSDYIGNRQRVSSNPCRSIHHVHPHPDLFPAFSPTSSCCYPPPFRNGSPAQINTLHNHDQNINHHKYLHKPRPTDPAPARPQPIRPFVPPPSRGRINAFWKFISTRAARPVRPRHSKRASGAAVQQRDNSQRPDWIPQSSRIKRRINQTSHTLIDDQTSMLSTPAPSCASQLSFVSPSSTLNQIASNSNLVPTVRTRSPARSPRGKPARLSRHARRAPSSNTSMSSNTTEFPHSALASATPRAKSENLYKNVPKAALAAAFVKRGKDTSEPIVKPTISETASFGALSHARTWRPVVYPDSTEPHSFAGFRGRFVFGAEGSSVSSCSDREEDALNQGDAPHLYLSRRQLRAMQIK